MESMTNKEFYAFFTNLITIYDKKSARAAKEHIGGRNRVVKLSDRVELDYISGDAYHWFQMKLDDVELNVSFVKEVLALMISSKQVDNIWMHVYRKKTRITGTGFVTYGKHKNKLTLTFF